MENVVPAPHRIKSNIIDLEAFRRNKALCPTLSACRCLPWLTCAYIQARTEAVLGHFGLPLDGVPDPFVLATKWLGGRSVYSVAAETLRRGVAGCIFPSGIVWIRDTLSPPLKRYVLAHELGHLALGHATTFPVLKEREAEADYFALHLLVPWRALAHAQQAGKHSVPSLAAAFNIPEPVIQARLDAERGT